VCTVEGERAMLVCDLAIGRVRQELTTAFEHGITFTHVDFQPTLVEAGPDIDAERFIAIVRSASAASQLASPLPESPDGYEDRIEEPERDRTASGKPMPDALLIGREVER
jgi:hypothetical protein